MKGTLFDEDVEVVVQRPESAIEEPVGGFREGQAIPDEAGASLAEAADVSGVEDGGAVLGDHPVAGEGAGEVVGGQDFKGEAGFPFAGELRRWDRRRRVFGRIISKVDTEQSGQSGACRAGKMG